MHFSDSFTHHLLTLSSPENIRALGKRLNSREIPTSSTHFLLWLQQRLGRLYNCRMSRSRSVVLLPRCSNELRRHRLFVNIWISGCSQSLSTTMQRKALRISKHTDKYSKSEEVVLWIFNAIGLAVSVTAVCACQPEPTNQQNTSSSSNSWRMFSNAKPSILLMTKQVLNLASYMV